MRITSVYTIITVTALFCFTYADAQQKPSPKKQPVKTKATKPLVKKTVVTDKKVTSLAKSLTDTTKGGNKTQAKQQDQKSGLSEEIVVTTAYKPILAEAVKIRRNPDLEDKEPFKAPLNYLALDKMLQQNTSIRELPAMNMPKEQDADLKNNYIKAGFGNLKTSYGELYINNGRDEALQIGGYLKHLAQNGDNKQNSSKEEAGVFGKSIGEVSTISGRVNYNYRSNYFYGFEGFGNFNPPVLLSVDKQHFSTLSGEGEIAKNYKDEDNQFIYALKLGGYAFNNAFRAKENNVAVSGYINETVGQFYAGLSGTIDFSTVSDSSYSINNNIIRANPYLKFQGDNYKIDAGVNIVSEFGNSTRFFIFPAAKLEFQIIPKYVRLFAEARGDVNKSSIRDFSETNPFIGQNITIKNSIDQLDISIGLKGMLAPGLGFKATIFRNSVKDMPLFVSAFDFTKGYNRFNVIYDNGRSRVNGFNGELDYKASDDLNIFGRVEFKDYQLASEAQAWNLPNFRLTAGTTIHINKQININGSLVFRGTTQDKTGVTLSSFADISGGIEYKATNQIFIFGQVNNLLDNNYQTWLYYPNYGFNIFGGVGYKF